MSESNHILVVDDSPTQLRQIQMVLENDGFSVRTANNGSAALASIKTDPPTVVITDLQMPEMDGFQLVATVRETAPAVPVIVTTAQGSEEIVAKVLRHGASSYVPKRDIHSELIPVVRQVLSINQISLSVRRVAKFAVESSIKLCLENDEGLIPSVIARLELPLVELDLFDDGERMQIAMALDESLLNAIVHGNLEVSSDLREIDDGEPYAALIKERKSEAPYDQRRVMVSLHATTQEATIMIRDDGPGFDRESLRDPTDPDNLELCGGRGLMLINAFMDEVLHNQAGNEITLIKRKCLARSASD
jgi:CheY-like chemotaxis protein/anti-sigma regulatory factor (Ser/Thr protein kinase)